MDEGGAYYPVLTQLAEAAYKNDYEKYLNSLEENLIAQ